MGFLVALAVTALTVQGRTSATPSIAADGAFVAIAWTASTPDGATDVYVATSRDGGVKFGAPVRVNGGDGNVFVSGEQPPRIVLVHRTGRVPELIVAWTAKVDRTVIRTARSIDGGATFKSSGLLERITAAGARGWEALAADARGAVHAVWLDHREMKVSAAPWRVPPPAGKPVSTERSAATSQHADMSAKSAIYYTTLGGDERVIARGVCYCCKTALATGPHGEIYAAWRQVYDGNVRDIAFSSSRDDGNTFAEPVRVSRDGWVLQGCPDDGPAMTVDADGTIHLVWPTLVETPEPHIEIFYASSRDGRTFTPRQRVETLGSLKASHPQIALIDGGRLAIAWDEIVSGARRAAVRIAKPLADGRLASEALTVLNDGKADAALYPALARVPDGVLAAWTSGAGDTTIRIRRIESAQGVPSSR